MSGQSEKAQTSRSRPRVNRALRNIMFGVLATDVVSAGLGVQHVMATRNDPQADTLFRKIIPTAVVLDMIANHNVRPTPECSESGAAYEVPSYEEARQRVQNIDFVENDLHLLEQTKSRILQAETVEQAKAIAAEYLLQREIPINFYGPDDHNKVIVDIQAIEWNETDQVKKQAITNVVDAFASMPRQIIDGLENTVFGVPDHLAEAYGFAASPENLFGHFSIVIALSAHASPNHSIMLHEFLGHRVHYEVCGTSGIGSDKLFSEFGNSSERRLDIEFASEYGRDAGPLEDYATVTEDLYTQSISHANTPRGSHALHDKQLIVLHRIQAATGMDPLDILAIAEIIRVHGKDVHPLAALHSSIAPFVHTEFEVSETPVMIRSSQGNIPLSCKEDGNRVECETEVSGALLDVETEQQALEELGEEPHDWYSDYADILSEAFIEHFNIPADKLNGHISYGSFNADLPHRSRAVFRLGFARD